jgi:hypothetical protein
VLHHGGLNYAVAARLPGEDELRVVLGAYQAPREGSGGGTVEVLLPVAANGIVEVAAEGRLADRLALTAIRLDAEQGWAELVFDGSMPPRMADVRVLGASGDVLPILTETVQYAKGADGRVVEGTTTIRFAPGDNTRVQVTVERTTTFFATPAIELTWR